MSVSAESVDPWQRALQNARLRSPASFDQWFSSVQFDGYNDGVLGLTARDEFVRDWVKTHFLPAMLGDIEQASGLTPDSGIRVDWRISSQLASPIGVLPENDAAPLSRLPPVPRAPRPVTLEPPAQRNDAMSTDRDSEPPPRSTRRPPAGDAASSARGAGPRAIPQQRIGDPINPKHTFPNFVVGPSNELAYAAAVASAGPEGPR